MHADSDSNDDSGGIVKDGIVTTARDWIVRLATGDVTEAEMRRLKSWLAESPDHQAVFARERAFWQRLGRLEPVADPESWSETRREADDVARRGRRRARPAIIVGGLIAACLALFVVYGDIRIAILADYQTAAGARQSITLPDGSIAHLNTDTAIAVTYAADERRIDLLRGEAFFEVMPDPAKPFRVIAVDGVVQAVGTAFVVRTWADRATVAVTDGTVLVTSPAPPSDPGASAEVRQGQTTRYHQGLPPEAAGSIDVAAAALWRRGEILIDDLPLDEAVAELDRYRPGRILLLGDALSYAAVSGAFDIDRIDDAVAGLAATHGLGITEVTPYLLIVR
jgi:transmembrane sensor